MFKLLKDLTRPPEPLDRPPLTTPLTSNSNGLQPYLPRQRSRSPASGRLAATIPPETVGIGQSSASKQDLPDKEEEVEETDGDALRVVELIKTLENGGDGNHAVMIYVEVSRTE